MLGIDPGIANTGYGLVEAENGKLSAISFGSIRTDSKDTKDLRLDRLYRKMMNIIEELSPDVVVLESLFFSTNRKSASAVGEARGVIILACSHSGVPFFEYAPLEVKMTVAGNGNAGKEQVKYMVEHLLGITESQISLHATDALAMAICYIHRSRLRSLSGKDG
ncbi:MAG: crossover junction endodeoxyribonuclease RuvC [Actinomycetota bacterium]|nr:crossover junction endodeoxyribonuclease RuvC [Actinomycetota bacterium]